MRISDSGNMEKCHFCGCRDLLNKALLTKTCCKAFMNGFRGGYETVALINAHAATLFDGKLFYPSCISECTSDADSFPKSLQGKSRTLKTFLYSWHICLWAGWKETCNSKTEFQKTATLLAQFAQQRSFSYLEFSAYT